MVTPQPKAVTKRKKQDIKTCLCYLAYKVYRIQPTSLLSLVSIFKIS